ncbi:MAG: class II aldolase/adducin family protein [Lachnospiraceae bacterium]|nr:class II aldolase/adducin family protein [Lachnospiraceae bacterium]
MEETIARGLVTLTGRELLEKGLVARTWGNVSCRVDKNHFLITPSGLSYLETKEEDLALYNMEDGTYEGERKPSSEKGIHAGAYEIFPDVNFVIHTHQVYASAIGLTGIEYLDITKEEMERLGGLAVADYGLPGQKKLRENVKAAFGTGAKTVLMVHHGAVILGKDKEDAMEKSILLEEICKRNCKGLTGRIKQYKAEEKQRLLSEIHQQFSYVGLVETRAVMLCANDAMKIKAQLDDMAQMIGREIIVASKSNAARAIRSYNAVLVPGVGAVVRGIDEDDMQAMKILVNKAAVAARHTDALGEKALLSKLDCGLMNVVYKLKYSKQKNR